MKRIMVILLLFVMIGLSFATRYYVSPAGNDTLPGTASQPWRTPGYGSKNISSGDTLIILSGDYVMSVYWDDMITPPSGSSGHPTVILGQGATKPRMRGIGSLFACVQLPGDAAYITIKNLELTSVIDTPYTGGCRGGISAASDADTCVKFLTFEDIELHRVEDMGINLGGDAKNILFKRCNIHHTAYSCIGGPTAHGMGCVNVVIDSCYLGYAGWFYDGEDTVTWIWDRPDGMGFEPSQGPIIVRYTTSEHNMGDGLDSKSKRTTIHHCYVANNYGDGVKLWGDSSFVSNTLIYGTGGGFDITTPWVLLIIGTNDVNAYFEITNVTMWDSPERPSHYAASVQYDEPTIPITLRMRNVIVMGLRQFYADPIVNVIADHNLFYMNDDDVLIYANGIDYDSGNIGSLGAGNICANPQFIAPPVWGETGNFHLQPTSPAINTGADVSLTDDLEFRSRPYGAGYDMGCYEWRESTRVEQKESKSVWSPIALFSPSSRMLILKSAAECDYSIYDITGKIVGEGKFMDEAKIPFEVPSGIYFAVFQNSQEKRIGKFVAIR